MTDAPVVKHLRTHTAQALAAGSIIAYGLLVPVIAHGTHLEPGLAALAWIPTAVAAGLAVFPEVMFGLFVSRVHTLALLSLLPFAAVQEIRGEPLIVVIAVVTALLVRKKQLTFVVSRAVIAQFVFYGLLVLGAARTVYSEDAITEVWQFSHSNLMPFVVPLLFAGDVKRLRNMILAFWVGCLAWGIAGPFLAAQPASVRMALEGLGAIGLSRTAAVGALLGSCFLIWRAADRRTVVIAPLCGLLVYQMILTGTRGALVAFLISLLMVLWVSARLQSPRRLLLVAFAIALLGVGVGLVLAPPEIADRLVNPESYRGEFDARQTAGPGQRLYLYRQAWEMFLSSPLLGLGPRAFEGIAIYPHNIFLEVAVELGLAGLMAFSLFLAFTLRSAWNGFSDPTANPARRQVIALSLVGLTFFLAEAEFSHNVVHNGEIWFFSGLMCAAAASPTLRRMKSADFFWGRRRHWHAAIPSEACNRRGGTRRLTDKRSSTGHETGCAH